MKVIKKPNYFDGKISRDFMYLTLGRISMLIALGFISLFLPIFLYQLFDDNLYGVMFFFMANSTMYLFLVGWGTKILNKIGFKRSISIAVAFGSIYWGLYYFLDRGLDTRFILLSIVLLLIYKMFYWVPYHSGFAKFTNKKERGRQVSFVWVIIALINVVIPILSGFLISKYNFGVVFILALIFYAGSVIPYSKISKINERYEWSYKKAWKEFFSKKRRNIVIAYMADGAETFIAAIIWPIFMWQILEGNYLQVGSLSALIIFVTIIMQLIIGKITDKMDKNKMLKYGTVLYSLGWIVKIFIFTAFQIFIVSTYHSLTRILVRTPFDTLNYEISADQGHYVDEYTVLHEMAIHSGIIIMTIFTGVVFLFASIEWTFILAAFTVLFFNLLRNDSADAEDREIIASMV